MANKKKIMNESKAYVEKDIKKFGTLKEKWNWVNFYLYVKNSIRILDLVKKWKWFRVYKVIL